MAATDPHWELPTRTGIQVGSRVVERRFEGNAGLFRDQHGRVAVEEQEGRGQALGDGPVAWERDESEPGPGEFREVVTAVRTGDGPVQTVVRVAADAQLAGEPRERVMEANGPGWVVGARGPWTLVDDGSVWPAVSRGFPVPFWLGVTGDVEIVREPALRVVALDAFDLSDRAALAARGWRVQNGSELTELRSTLADGTAWEQPVMSHLNEASWDAAVPEDAAGLILRKRYDRFHGRQRARVRIDGEAVGWWYLPDEDRRHRWAWAMFGVPVGALRGKPHVRIGIDPPVGAPLWSVATIEVYAVLPVA